MTAPEAVQPRSQDEIAERAREQMKTSIFPWALEVLAEQLDREHFAEFAKDDADLSDIVAPDPATVPTRAADYLGFAFGKALDHRGISAGRSVEKMREYAWLLRREDVVAQMDAAEHEQYGVPKLLVYARAFDLPVPDDPRLARMGEGEPCEPGCTEGCGR